MRRGFLEIYGAIGAIFGLILAGPLWYAALIGEPAPRDLPEFKSLALVLFLATLRGILRGLAWLPSLIFHVGLQKMSFTHWLIVGWW